MFRLLCDLGAMLSPARVALARGASLFTEALWPPTPSLSVTSVTSVTSVRCFPPFAWLSHGTPPATLQGTEASRSGEHGIEKPGKKVVQFLATQGIDADNSLMIHPDHARLA
jgi:hypothetical protein